MAYAADYTAYSAVAREDNLRNTITLTLKGKNGPWTLSVNNPLLYVDGSRRDQFYNTYSPLGYAATRERRNQIQERNTSILRYDAPNWFARAVANATYYNLLIDEHNPVGAYKGYLNWVNRDDINAGVDLGYKLMPDFAFTAGWRIGQQTQARLYYSLVDNDNTYNRALLGFEGKLLSWLQLQLVAGPDFRRYSDAAHPGITGDRHTWLYTQGQLTANLSSNDSLTASNKIWHWVSSTGLTSYQDTSYSLIYKHVFSAQFSASAGVSEVGARYDAPAVRNDWTLKLPRQRDVCVQPQPLGERRFHEHGGPQSPSDRNHPGPEFPRLPLLPVSKGRILARQFSTLPYDYSYHRLPPGGID